MKRAAAAALLLALGAAGTLWAYTYQGNTSPANGGRPYHPSLPVEWRFNDRTSDSLPNVSAGSDPRQAILEGFAEWAAESDFAVTQGADSGIDSTGADGVNLMTFADTPTNRMIVGEPATCSGLGALAVTLLRFDGQNRITDADIIFNPCTEWSTTGVEDTFAISSVATHEIGHWLGLDHSVVGGATMYPFGAEYGNFSGSAFAPTSISGDDRAGANGLYPDAGFAAKTGAIAGTVTRDGSPLYGAHVVATRLSDGIVFGSDITRGENVGQAGEYLIENLPPGDYVLHAEPADGPTEQENWGPKSDSDFFWYDAPFPLDFKTSFLGGAASPTVVAVSAGGTATPADLPVTDGAPADNPTRIGIIDADLDFSGLPLLLQPGSTTIVAIVDVGGGLSADSVLSVACSDPAVTIGPVSEPFVFAPPTELIAFAVVVPAAAVPGPRSLIFTTDHGETSTLTGFLDVAGPTDEQACANAFDDDGDGFTDCEDSDCEAEEVCTDQCPADPFKTEPGVCGCGVPDDDDDGDGTLNCLDDCPADPNKTAPGACGCGVSDEDLDGDGVADCCTAGDVWPDGAGDDAVDLRDWALGVQKAIEGSVALVARDLTCGNVAPVASTCLGDAGPRRICPAPDAAFDEGDVDVIRAVSSATAAVSCEPCLATRPGDDGTARRVGDVAPRATEGDGVVNVGDVLLTLNWAVGNLEPPSPGQELFERADVAPASLAEGLLVVAGDDTLNVADVLGLLRHAVGLDTYAWPLRSVDLAPTEVLPTHRGFQAVTTGWPAWAESWGHESQRLSCNAASGLDVLDDRVVVSCFGASDESFNTLVRLFYRAPEVVAYEGVSVEVTLLSPGFALTGAAAELTDE